MVINTDTPQIGAIDLDSWDEFERKYKMTPRDWDEWRRTKHLYKDSQVNCVKCGATIIIIPFFGFLLTKRKWRPICENCKKG